MQTAQEAYQTLIKMQLKVGIEKPLDLEEVKAEIEIDETEGLKLKGLLINDMIKAINNHQHFLLSDSDPALVYHSASCLLVLCGLALVVNQLCPNLIEHSELTNLQYAVKQKMVLDQARETLLLPPGLKDGIGH